MCVQDQIADAGVTIPEDLYYAICSNHNDPRHSLNNHNLTNTIDAYARDDTVTLERRDLDVQAGQYQNQCLPNTIMMYEICVLYL